MLRYRHAQYQKQLRPAVVLTEEARQQRRLAAAKLSVRVKAHAFACRRREQQQQQQQQRRPDGGGGNDDDTMAAGETGSSHPLGGDGDGDEFGTDAEAEDNDNDEEEEEEECKGSADKDGGGGGPMTAAGILRALARAVGTHHSDFSPSALDADLAFGASLVGAPDVREKLGAMMGLASDAAGADDLLGRLDALLRRWRNWARTQPGAADALASRGAEGLLLPLLVAVLQYGFARLCDATVGLHIANAVLATLQSVAACADASVCAAVLASTELLPITTHMLAQWSGGMAAHTATPVTYSLAAACLTVLDTMCGPGSVAVSAMLLYAPPAGLPLLGTLIAALPLAAADAATAAGPPLCAPARARDALVVLIGTLLGHVPLQLPAYEAAAPVLVALAAAGCEAAHATLATLVNALDAAVDGNHGDAATANAIGAVRHLVHLGLPAALVALLQRCAHAGPAASQLQASVLQVVDALAGFLGTDDPLHALMAAGLVEVLAATIPAAPLGGLPFLFMARIATNMAAAATPLPTTAPAAAAGASVSALSLLLGRGGPLFGAVAAAGRQPGVGIEVANESAWLLVTAIEAAQCATEGLAALAQSWQLPHALVCVLNSGCADNDACLQRRLIAALHALFDDGPQHLQAFADSGGLQACIRQRAHMWDALLVSQLHELLGAFFPEQCRRASSSDGADVK